jgi:transcriptional regulator with PAS, ATPase and Fis domain
MSQPALYVGSDQSVWQQLSHFWRERFGEPVTTTAGFDGLGQAITGAGWLFFDARDELAGEALLRFAAAQPRARFPKKTIVLHDGVYPFAVADTLHLLAAGRLQLPLISDELAEVVTALATSPDQMGTRTLPESRSLSGRSIQFTTRTPTLFPILEQLDRIAPHNVTLLLIGETGTGKTTLAHLVHERSPRGDDKFMTVACGALPADLIESELFGHVRGAFTGAERAKVGRFEAAEKGTLLLDEIDVLSPREQTRLLRVIETGEFEPVGSTETRTTTCRLVVAANVDLKGLTEKGQFRSDLYYRLNVLEFHLPPLRERPLDLIPMAMLFIAEFTQQHHIDVRGIEPDFLDLVQSHNWPGNIRELKNQIRRAVLFARGGRMSASELAIRPSTVPVVSTASAVLETPVAANRLSDQVADREREILMDALRANNFKRTAAARSLGISRVGLYKKMRKYGLLTVGHAPARPLGTPLPAAPLTG